MPTFQFETKDGQVFEFDAPDALTAASMWNKAQAQVAGQPQPKPQAPPAQSGSGTILPFSWDEKGVRFDPNAGLFGFAQNVGRSAADMATYPGDVMAGKVDPLSNEGIGRNLNFAGWATGTGAGAGWARKPKVSVPTSQDLLGLGAAGRNAAHRMGVEYTTDSVVGLASKAQTELLQDGLGPEVASQTNAVLARLQKVPDDPTATADFTTTLEAARNNLQTIAQSATEGSERAAASRAISALDRYIQRPDPADVVAGDAAALGETFATANGNYAAGARSRTVEAIGTRAGLRTSATNSGLNLDNSIRQRVASFIEPSPNGGPSLAQRSGFTADEIALLENVVQGKTGANTLRWLSNVLGGGGGLGQFASTAIGGMAGTGAAVATGNPAMALLGLVPPAAGLGMKMAENAATKRALKGAAQELRMRSPAFIERESSVPAKPLRPQERAAVLKMLLLAYPQQQATNPAWLEQARKTLPAGSTIY